MGRSDRQVTSIPRRRSASVVSRPTSPAEQLLTTPVEGLENYEQMLRELTSNRDAVKVFVSVASGRESAPEVARTTVGSAA